MNRRVFLITSVLVLLILHGMILQKELMVTQGKTVFLRLGPRDPRALMMGDYMQLRYEQPPVFFSGNAPTQGLAVFEIDARGIASFSRLHGASPLKPNELLIKFQKRGSAIMFGPESFFFQEGHANHYDNARFGELKVTETGAAVLVGMRAEDLSPLGPKARK
jgi:uncharacterized membrane-anchored protein